MVENDYVYASFIQSQLNFLPQQNYHDMEIQYEMYLHIVSFYFSAPICDHRQSLLYVATGKAMRATAIIEHFYFIYILNKILSKS
jgi:hypothetical protein